MPRRGLESEGDAGRRRGERDFAGLVEEKTPENVAGGRRGERAKGLLGGGETADAERPGVVGMERRDSNSVLDCDFDSNSAFDSNAEPDFESVSLGANRQRACAVIEAQKRTRIDVEPA